MIGVVWLLAGAALGAVVTRVHDRGVIGDLRASLEAALARHDAWNRSAQAEDLDVVTRVASGPMFSAHEQDGVVVLPKVSAPKDRLPPSAAIKPPVPYDQDAEVPR